MRKIERRNMADDASDINSEGTYFLMVEGDQFFIRSIRVPNSTALEDRLRPRFAVAEAKLNPA